MVKANWAQIRVGAAIAHLDRGELDAAVENVTPVLDIPPELRVATVTGYTDNLARRLNNPAPPPRTGRCGPTEPDPRVHRRCAAEQGVTMSPLPTQLRNRWENRAEPAPGFGTVYWHVLMSRYEGAREAAGDVRDVLSQFSGFHLTPPEWLHMTTYVAGPAEQFSRDQLAQMIGSASEALAKTTAIEANISRILYHPEAVMLAIDPVESLRPIRKAAEVAGDVRRSSDGGTDPQWIPHMTVAYSIASQSAKPVIATLGVSISPRFVAIDRMTLVIQWGPERSWEWEPVGEILMGNTA